MSLSGALRGVAAQPVDSGSTAWVLASAALVLLMTPGVAFFYGGMVRARHALAVLMQSFTTIAVVSLLWVVVGYSLVFGTGTDFVGDLTYVGLRGMDQPVPGFTGDTAMAVTVDAVTTTTGMCDVAGSVLSASTTAKPSTSGMRRSSTMRSGSSRRASSIASRPPYARSTWLAIVRMRTATSSTDFGSSSTTRTRIV